MNETDEAIAVLRQRIEMLEKLCMQLQTRVSGLEARAGSEGQVDFQMPDEEQTV